MLFEDFVSYVEAIAKSQTYFLRSLKAFKVNIKQCLHPFLLQWCDIFSVKQEIQQINVDWDMIACWNVSVWQVVGGEGFDSKRNISLKVASFFFKDVFSARYEC